MSNNGLSMFGITLDGAVHHFDLSLTNEELYNAIDMPLQCVAISPVGDIVIASSLKIIDPCRICAPEPCPEVRVCKNVPFL